jgi:8-oxo-dGTP pyrophosphatase MutT (NUDIX family)
MGKNHDDHVSREIRVHPTRDVALVGLFDADGRVLLVRTSRFPHHWQPVGGGVRDVDSSPIDTIRREVREEFGFVLPVDGLRLQLTTDYDFGEGLVYFYLAPFPNDSQLLVDKREVVEWRWFTMASTKDLKMFVATRKFLASLNWTAPAL